MRDPVSITIPCRIPYPIVKEKENPGVPSHSHPITVPIPSQKAKSTSMRTDQNASLLPLVPSHPEICPMEKGRKDRPYEQMRKAKQTKKPSLLSRRRLTKSGCSVDERAHDHGAGRDTAEGSIPEALSNTHHAGPLDRSLRSLGCLRDL